MIDFSQFGTIGAGIALLWTLSQEVRFWKLCANCPYKEFIETEKEKNNFSSK